VSDEQSQIEAAVTARAAELMNEAMRRAGVEAVKRGVRINDGFVLRAFCELAAVRIANLELAMEALLAGATRPQAEPPQARAAVPDQTG